MPDPQKLSDHDLLIHISTNVEALVKRGDDHETRLRRVEKILYIGIGASAALGSAAGSLVSKLIS